MYPHMASAVDAMKESLEQVTIGTLLEELKELLKDYNKEETPQLD